MRLDWVNCQFKDIAKIRNGYAFKSKDFKKTKELENDIPLIKQSQLNGDSVDLASAVYLPYEYLEKYKNYILNYGDVLIGMSGSIGKLCIYNQEFPSLQNQRTGKIEELASGQIANKFFWLYLQTVEAKLTEMSKGVGVQNVSGKTIEELPLSLPPLLEQKAIVAKIEQLFSELDNGVTNLKTAQAKLKIYRQAVLKKAFEGELTKEWREQKKIQFNWIHTTTGEIMPNISSGSTPKAEFLSEDGEIQFLKVYNLNFDGTLNKDKDPVFTTRNIHRVQNKRAITKAGDVLINIVGPPLGKTSMIPLNCNLEYNINQAIVRFRPNEQILPKFLSFFMQNPKAINWLEGTSKATAGQRNVKVTTCRLIPISLPSILEQNQIVQEIESRLSVCDKIEETIETSLAKSEALRQSILKKAFEGKLLSEQELKNIKNHPEYESAEALIERIKNERDK